MIRSSFPAAIAATALLFSGSTADAAEVTGPVLAVISHPVKDYAAWRVIYDGAESVRAKAGVTGAEVFHDPTNPNQMVLIHRFKTVAAAKAFLADPDLKTAMDKGGVTAAPSSIIAVGKPGHAAAELGPVLAVVSHPVKDYAAWRVAYNEAAPIRQKAGVTGAEVFRDPNTPNNLVIIHRFKTVAAAHAFLADPDLKAAMDKGGVTAAPTAIIAVKN